MNPVQRIYPSQPNRWIRRATCILAALVIALAGVWSYVNPAPALAATAYIYTTFRGDDSAGQKLWVYTSGDAVNYSQYAATGFGGNTGVLRDPTLLKHTDGKYYIAFTNQHWNTNSTTFGIASSSDLRTWTQIATVNAGVANVRHTWAPEWLVEGSTVRLIVNIDQTTCSSCFKPYLYTAQNSALTSWSGPVDMGIGTNHIDLFVVKSGSTYHGFVKNETSKFIEHWTSSSLTSGWSNRGTLWSSGYEGPAVVRMANGTWRIYADHYSAGDGIYTATSSDLNTWSSLSKATCSGCRHGTAILDTSFGGGTSTPPPTVYYRITNRNSGKVIDVQNPNLSDGANIGQWTWNGGNWQQWQFQDAGGGYFRIVSRHSGKCLDVSGASTANGANIIQWSCNGGANQQWQWAAIGSYFQLKARHSGKCLDVVNSSTADGADIQQFTCGTGNNQQWTRTQT